MNINNFRWMMTMTTAKRFEIQELRSNKPLAQPELDLARVTRVYNVNTYS